MGLSSDLGKNCLDSIPVDLSFLPVLQECLIVLPGLLYFTILFVKES